MKSSSGSWSNIIWREWLHTEDVKYGAQLLELVADKLPVTWATIAVIAGSGAGLGIPLGAFLWILVNWRTGTGSIDQEYHWNTLIFYIIGAGGITGVLFSLFTWFAFTWRYSWATFFTGLRAGLMVGIVFGLIHPLTGLIAGGVTGSAWIMGWLKPKTNTELTLLLLSILGFGAALIPIFSTSTVSIAIVLLIIALFYLSLGPGLALYGLMMLLLSPEQKKKLKRLSGELSNWFMYDRATIPLAEYLFRSNLWLRLLWSEPSMAEVEAALLEASTAQPKRGQEWPGLLRRLAKQRQQPPPLDRLLAALQEGGWKARFIAGYGLVAAGSEAVGPLRQLLLQHKSAPLVVKLLKNIALESRQRWADQVDNLICPNCLAYCQEHLLPTLPHQPGEIYYGCRICRQSRDFWHCPQGAVALLDNQGKEKTGYQNGLLRVNALTHPSRFDFDRVEIIQATDEEVERFAIQTANNADPIQHARLKEIPCLISDKAGLSENTVRVLQRLFGQVEVRPGLR